MEGLVQCPAGRCTTPGPRRNSGFRSAEGDGTGRPPGRRYRAKDEGRISRRRPSATASDSARAGRSRHRIARVPRVRPRRPRNRRLERCPAHRGSAVPPGIREERRRPRKFPPIGGKPNRCNSCRSRTHRRTARFPCPASYPARDPATSPPTTGMRVLESGTRARLSVGGQGPCRRGGDQAVAVGPGSRSRQGLER